MAVSCPKLPTLPYCLDVVFVIIIFSFCCCYCAGKLPDIAMIAFLPCYCYCYYNQFCCCYCYCAGKLPEIAKMLTEFTGQTFERTGVHNLVRRLQKRFLVIDTETGEGKVEFRGVQVLVLSLLLILLLLSFLLLLLLLYRYLPRGWD